MYRYTVKIADDGERGRIYKLRHDVYARELRQHKENDSGTLTDDFDKSNTYIVVKINGDIAGFVCVTPPGGAYRLDCYIPRDRHPYIYDNMYECRLFTVVEAYRNSLAAPLLFYAAYRHMEEHGADRAITISRSDLVGLYEKTGMRSLNEPIQSGEVLFILMYAEMAELQKHAGKFERVIGRMGDSLDDQLPFELLKRDKCFHGGAFFHAVGQDFSTLEKSREVIGADVLDAWFDPSPKVVSALTEYLPWLAKTSPPIYAAGLAEAISQTRGVPVPNILTGGGSSGLIFTALPKLLKKGAKVLLPSPVYGEYAFVAETLLGCDVRRFPLDPDKDYALDAEALSGALKTGQYDMLILVNPNNPTGQTVPLSAIREIAGSLPEKTLLWIDEAYMDYTGRAGESAETLAASRPNVIVCKSMSKVYALSGLRCAYLVSDARRVRALAEFVPPWAVSLVAQVAAVNALKDPAYYQAQYRRTHENRARLIGLLSGAPGVAKITDGEINAILCELTVDIDKLLDDCARNNLFIRDARNMGAARNLIRVAVKSEEVNVRTAGILTAALRGLA